MLLRTQGWCTIVQMWEGCGSVCVFACMICTVCVPAAQGDQKMALDPEDPVQPAPPLWALEPSRTCVQSFTSQGSASAWLLDKLRGSCLAPPNARSEQDKSSCSGCSPLLTLGLLALLADSLRVFFCPATPPQYRPLPVHLQLPKPWVNIQG